MEAWQRYLNCHLVWMMSELEMASILWDGVLVLGSQQQVSSHIWMPRHQRYKAITTQWTSGVFACSLNYAY